MTKQFILSFLLLLSISYRGQNRFFGIGISNQVNGIPVAGIPLLFKSLPHPGIDVELAQQVNQSKKHQIWLSGESSVFYHRYFQTAIKVNASCQYQYSISNRWNTHFGINGGYLHSFYQYEVFELTNNGIYESTSHIKSRPQFNAGIAFGFTYGLNKDQPDKVRLVLNYKTFVQGLFAGSYIPIVPYNSFSLGLRIKLNSKINDNEK